MVSQVCLDLAYRKKVLLDSIDEAFESFIKSGIEQNNSAWTFVKKVYKNYKDELITLYSLQIFCRFVFKLFFIFNCQDHELMIKIIYLYHSVLNLYEDLELCLDCEHSNNPSHYHYEDLISTRLILKNVNKVPENVYKFTNRELYSKFTIHAIYEGDCAFLQYLVKYRLSYLPEDVVSQIESELELL